MTKLQPRKPRGAGWERILTPLVTRDACGSNSVTYRRSDGTRVCSSLANAELPGEPPAVGPTWMLSVSCNQQRASNAVVRRALRAFRLERADEDNHIPGIIRMFFMPVDPARRSICECKLTEEIVVEPDGFVWTNPHGGRTRPELCRGCEHEAQMRAIGKESSCPIHPK